jgi:hypothetical protein
MASASSMPATPAPTSVTEPEAFLRRRFRVLDQDSIARSSGRMRTACCSTPRPCRLRPAADVDREQVVTRGTAVRERDFAPRGIHERGRRALECRARALAAARKIDRAFVIA